FPKPKVTGSSPVGTATRSMVYVRVTAAEIHECHRLATDLFGERLTQPGIYTSSSLSLHIRDERSIHCKRSADARMACTFTDNLDVYAVQGLMRDGGVAQTVKFNPSNADGLDEPIEGLGDAIRIKRRSISMTENQLGFAKTKAQTVCRLSRSMFFQCVNG